MSVSLTLSVCECVFVYWDASQVLVLYMKCWIVYIVIKYDIIMVSNIAHGKLNTTLTIIIDHRDVDSSLDDIIESLSTLWTTEMNGTTTEQPNKHTQLPASR